LIAQLKKVRRRSQATRKRRENKKEHILFGMKMNSLHQVKMKKPTYV